MNTVARRIFGGDPWIGGGPYMVNAVAKRIYGVIHGLVNFGVWQSLSSFRLGQGKRDTDP